MSLQPGKLPSSMLAELLSKIVRRDQRVVLGPGIGRDAAVIRFGGGLLVAKTDPVTFAADDIGWYAVHVNANDVACMGARPAWFLATALLPPGAPDSLPARIFEQLNAACVSLGIELVGGHTEVTLGIERPIVVGAMLGEASDEEIVTGENVRVGDALLMTKGIAIEGTALLAKESATELLIRGVEGDVIESARRMLFDPGISVVRDAKTICHAAKPRLMHDPTEGGVATALHEMAQAAGARLSIDVASIRIFDETRAVCEALKLDPLGLLASGALLAIVAQDDADHVLRQLNFDGIATAMIGEVVTGDAGVILGAGNQAAALPVFARDELARFYDEVQHPEGL